MFSTNATNATNNLNGLQQPFVLTPFQTASKTQMSAAMSKLGYDSMTILVKKMITADPNTNIGDACKMARIVYVDLTSFEIALEKSDVTTIKRIISVITATDPKNAQKRLLNIIEKISAHAAKQETPNLTFLKNVLELPAFLGEEINSNQSKILDWAIDHDLGELVGVMVKSKILSDLDLHKVIRSSCREGKINIFKALLQNEMIPKTVLCNFRTLKRVSSRNYIEMVKLIQPHYIPSTHPTENNQIIMNKVVVKGHVEVAKWLEEKSIGNLNEAISSENITCSAVNGSVEMLQFGLTRTNDKGAPLVATQHLNSVIEYSLRYNRPVGAKFAYKILLERNALIDYTNFIHEAATYSPMNNSRNKCLGFAYSLLQDYAEKFGKTEEWGNLAAKLLRAEIREENFHSTYHLLDDQFIDLSAAGNIILSINEKINQHDANKEKWLEVLRKTLFHFNFNAYHHGENIVKTMKSETTSPEVVEIADFYLKQSKLIDFDFIVSGSASDNREILRQVLKDTGAILAMSSVLAVSANYVTNLALKHFGYDV